jgi:hypothetical protein
VSGAPVGPMTYFSPLLFVRCCCNMALRPSHHHHCVGPYASGDNGDLIAIVKK